jgi:hypothetical protein
MTTDVHPHTVRDMDDHVEATPIAGTTSPAERTSRLPMVLVVVATFIAVLSAVTTWVKTQALDTDEWVSSSAALLADEEIQEALSVYLTDQLFLVVDLTAELEALLPDQLANLAGPLAGALRAPAAEAVDQVLASQRFAQVWATANRVAHEKVVAILRDETSSLTSVDEGTVTLELGQALRAIGESVGIPDAALDRIPADAGRITIVESQQLADAQSAVRVLDFLSWFLFVVVVGLYAMAVYLARGRRDRMLLAVGASIAIGGVAVLMLREIAVRTTVDWLVDDAANQPVATVVGQIATQVLREMAWTGITFGVLILAFAALLGSHRWAVAIRRSLGGFSESTGAVVAVTVLLLLGLVWWSPGRSFDRWVTALVLVALVIGAMAALVMRIRSEFPSDATAHTPDADPPAVGAPV